MNLGPIPSDSHGGAAVVLGSNGVPTVLKRLREA